MFPDPKQFTWTASSSVGGETSTFGVTVYVPPVEKLCRNCKWWKSGEYYDGYQKGTCGLIRDINQDIPEWTLACVSTGRAGMSGELFTMENFGCVHFEQKED